MAERRPWWRVLACLGSLVGLADLPAEARAGEPLTIRTYDAVGVLAHEMQSARQTGSRILERAGFSVIWLDCSSPRPANVLGPCDVPLTPRELVVRLAPAGAGNSADALGEAVIDVERRHGVLATVFADRVQVLAEKTNTSAGRLLGLAAAHEVGHLLLGSTRHAEGGLMRGHWLASEIRSERPADWHLGRSEASSMRRRLVARARLADDVLTGLRGVSVYVGGVSANAGLDCVTHG